MKIILSPAIKALCDSGHYDDAIKEAKKIECKRTSFEIQTLIITHEANWHSKILLSSEMRSA